MGYDKRLVLPRGWEGPAKRGRRKKIDIHVE